MRNVTPQMAAALAASILRPVLLVQATFTDEVVNVWSGVGPLTWNGITFTGVGSLGEVSTIEDSSAVEAKSITISLSGLDANLLRDTLQNYRVGLPVICWLGLFDNTGAMIPDPIVSFSGRMDQPTLSLNGETASISIACESRLLDMNVSVERRYTDADQQIDYPGDLGFRYVNSIQTVQIFFGRAPSSTNIFGSGGQG